MRYLGNKTKLLPTIESFAREFQLSGRSFVDGFSGTSVVGEHFKKLGFRVIGCDLLHSSYVSQIAKLEVSHKPRFSKLLEASAHRRSMAGQRFQKLYQARGHRDGRHSISKALALWELQSKPYEGPIFRNYSPGGPYGRRYFRAQHARDIDGYLRTLRGWFQGQLLAQKEFYFLLHCLLEASDKVANIAGVYAAYLKKWQSNTNNGMPLIAPKIVRGPIGQAVRGNANDFVGQWRADILYLDPPYNTRQYAAHYHLREVIADLATVPCPTKYESRLYGKTGLRPYHDLKSDYCSKQVVNGMRRCDRALVDLIEKARARHLIISYNEEGIIPKDLILDVLARYSGQSKSTVAKQHRAVEYRRFRSDADGRNGRRYKIGLGKSPNRVDEWLFYAKRQEPRPRYQRRRAQIQLR